MKKVILTIILASTVLALRAQVAGDSYLTGSTPDSLDTAVAIPGTQKPDTVPAPRPYIIRHKDTTLHRNAVYVELLGQGLLYSVNYDYRIIPAVSIRAGFTYWSLNSDWIILQFHKLRFLAFPVTVNYLVNDILHQKSSHLEIGLGLMTAFMSGQVGAFFQPKNEVTNHFGLVGIGTLGYRYQPKEGGVIFRAGYTPLFTTSGFQSYWGLSIGKTF